MNVTATGAEAEAEADSFDTFSPVHLIVDVNGFFPS